MWWIQFCSRQMYSLNPYPFPANTLCIVIIIAKSLHYHWWLFTRRTLQVFLRTYYISSWEKPQAFHYLHLTPSRSLFVPQPLSRIAERNVLPLHESISDKNAFKLSTPMDTPPLNRPLSSSYRRHMSKLFILHVIKHARLPTCVS